MKTIDIFKRKPDGGLAEWIEILEAGDNQSDAVLLCLLLELRRFRQDKSALIEQLEAAQRAEGSAKTRIAELERQWEFRAPTPEAYDAACKALEKHRQRADAAEAELKRRDELEPDYILYQCSCCGHETTDRMTRCPKCNHEPVAQRPLYDAAPAAVPEKVVKLPFKVETSNVPFAAYTWNAAIEECIKALDAAGVKWVEGE